MHEALVRQTARQPGLGYVPAYCPQCIDGVNMTGSARREPVHPACAAVGDRASAGPH
jgi:hypothetical protein